MSKNNIGRSQRPIFIPNPNEIGVIEKTIEFDWHMGMSSAVRKRSVKSLHEQAKQYGYYNILEASSKSEQEIGIRLSAFFLLSIQGYSVENLFQSSKVFEKGGPYRDLLTMIPRDAKKDNRLRESGSLIKFYFNKQDFPLEPKSLFYDWLYINVLFSDRNLALREEFFDARFDAFSDIEFNPKKSFSCQARTLALCVSLYHNESVKEFIEDPIGFSQKYSLYQQNNAHQSQVPLEL